MVAENFIELGDINENVYQAHVSQPKYQLFARSLTFLPFHFINPWKKKSKVYQADVGNKEDQHNLDISYKIKRQQNIAGNQNKTRNKYTTTRDRNHQECVLRI